MVIGAKGQIVVDDIVIVLRVVRVWVLALAPGRQAVAERRAHDRAPTCLTGPVAAVIARARRAVMAEV